MKNPTKNFQIGHNLESLIIDLLVALGFSDINSVHSTRDFGYDIQATYPSKSPTGLIVPQLWFVTLKHRPTSRVSTQDLAQALAFLQVKKADKALFVTTGNLTVAARDYASKFQEEFTGKLEIWDRDQLVHLLSQNPDLQKKHFSIISEFPDSLSKPQTPSQNDLIQKLEQCSVGKIGWQEFEKLCVAILTEVFVPPLKPPKEQARTFTGLERRDALFSLRGTREGWQEIGQEFAAKFLLCEFKNFAEPFTKDEVNQTRNYLKETIGRLGIIFSRKGPDEGALKMRNSIYAQEKKVILFFEDKHLIELLKLKAANQNPMDLLQDAIDDFYISYE